MSNGAYFPTFMSGKGTLDARSDSDTPHLTLSFGIGDIE